MKLFVISDLHVGTTARAADFCTDKESITCRNTAEFLDDLKALIKKESIEATHLLIAGDITQTASYTEFDLAAQGIASIVKLLKIDTKNVFFIPGNHDGNWAEEKLSIENKEPTEINIKKKYGNIENHSYFSKILENASLSSYYSDPYASIWSDDKLVVVGINSSAFDSANNDIHHGIVDIECLKKVDLHLKDLDSKNKLKVLLTHHHPKNYSDLTFPDTDFSIMKNADSLLKFATSNEFDLIVHGHKHIPRFDIHWDSMNYPVVSLCAGSFSASLKDYHNGVANFFHIIEVDDKCPDNSNARGRIVSWAYFDNHKWKEASFERDQISFKEYFGDIKNKRVLSKSLKSDIEKELESERVFRWANLLKSKPNLKYCNRNLLKLAISDICSELNLEYCPIEKKDDFILIPEGV